MWFEIKADSSIISGPNHKLREITNPIPSLLSSDKESDLRFAIEKLTSLRNGVEFGDKVVHLFIPPKLNWNTFSLYNIQDWSDLTEPLITTSIATHTLTQFLTSPLKMPKYQSRTQSCERALMEVT